MPASADFARLYASALNEYLAGNGEASLERAYDLGRRALKDGVGVLELAGIYGSSIADRLSGADVRIARRGARFLLESLSSFEMTHRGFREANAALRDLNETLERRVARRTDEAETARIEAEEANRAKADFLAVMSHELRTPLNAVLGYTELLETGIPGPVTEKQKNHLERIRVSANHLLELIEEVLAFAKVDPDREEISIKSIDLTDLIAEVVGVIQPLADERGLDLRVEAPKRDTPVRTDPKRLRQILVNLLSNAVKFTASGHVALRSRVEENWMTLEVEDTGSGIPKEHLQHVFEAFWQVEPSATRREGGTGLGLSVVKNLATRLGGEITVESEVGRGTTFTLRLPAAG